MAKRVPKGHTIQHTLTVVGISVLVSGAVSLGILGLNARLTAELIDRELQGGVPSPMDWERLESDEWQWDREEEFDAMHEAKDWKMWLPEDKMPHEDFEGGHEYDMHAEFKRMMNEAINAGDEERLKEVLDEYARWQQKQRGDDGMPNPVNDPHDTSMSNSASHPRDTGMYDAWVAQDDVHFLADEVTQILNMLQEKNIDIHPLTTGAAESAMAAKAAVTESCPAYDEKKWDAEFKAMLTDDEWEEEESWSWTEVEEIVLLLREIAEEESLPSELEDEMTYVAGYLENYLKTGGNAEHVTYKMGVAFDLLDSAANHVEYEGEWEEGSENMEWKAKEHEWDQGFDDPEKWDDVPMLEKQYSTREDYSLDCVMALTHARSSLHGVHELFMAQAEFNRDIADVLNEFYGRFEDVGEASDMMMKEGMPPHEGMSDTMKSGHMPPSPPHAKKESMHEPHQDDAKEMENGDF